MKVLVVDDDLDTIEVLALSLVTSHGWEVLVATTGAEALEFCLSGELDAVLLDVEMPVLDGPGVMAALRSDLRTAHLPVVFVTGCTEPALNDRLCALGATAVFPKPFDALRIGEQLVCCLGW